MSLLNDDDDEIILMFVTTLIYVKCPGSNEVAAVTVDAIEKEVFAE